MFHDPGCVSVFILFSSLLGSSFFIMQMLSLKFKPQGLFICNWIESLSSTICNVNLNVDTFVYLLVNVENLYLCMQVAR